MTSTTGLLLYVMLWVIVLFLVLPWGVRSAETVQKGHAFGAPENPRMGLKLLLTSLIAGLLWVAACAVLQGENLP